MVEALRRLALRGWTRLASGAGSRARKYRHLLGDAFGLDAGEVSLAVLMLRGPQTPGELAARPRLHDFPDLAAVQATLDRLIEHGHVARHERRPGQKEHATSSCWVAVSPGLARHLQELVETSRRQAARALRARQQQRPDRHGWSPRSPRAGIADLRSELAALRSELGD